MATLTPSAEALAATPQGHLEVPGTVPAVLATVEAWHNDESRHQGPFRVCFEQPCHAAQLAAQEPSHA